MDWHDCLGALAAWPAWNTGSREAKFMACGLSQHPFCGRRQEIRSFRTSPQVLRCLGHAEEWERKGCPLIKAAKRDSPWHNRCEDSGSLGCDCELQDDPFGEAPRMRMGINCWPYFVLIALPVRSPISIVLLVLTGCVCASTSILLPCFLFFEKRRHPPITRLMRSPMVFYHRLLR